ncbi:coiled-coil domain-containing protein 71 [Ambystoma mexicanum]|uniref:coiled-coil domain-containing protein 71 n=1 Tax=Ambystoma mexicanum TaxID=8296 RepID=UPI0037E7009F
MNVDVGHVEEKAVHSWSRISSVGKKALEEALRVFNPMSKDLTDTETQLVAFLQGLRDEGFQPTILRSKDVYGYNSCTADTPPQTGNWPQNNSKMTAAVSVSSKATLKSSSASKLSHAPVGISVNSSKVYTKSVSRGNSTHLLLRPLKPTESDTTKASAVGFPAHLFPGVYPAVRLSVVLEALVPLKATAASLKAKCKRSSLGIPPSEIKRLMLSGSTKHTPTGKNTKIVSRQKTPKGLKYFIKKAPASLIIAAKRLNGAVLKGPNGRVLKGPNGRVLKENNACKASGILNGRLLSISSQRLSVGAQSKGPKSKPKVDPSGKIQQKDKNNSQLGKRRKLVAEAQHVPLKKKSKSLTVVHKTPKLSPSQVNLLKLRVVKVDRSTSDDELRRRAQRILQVNLSPVIRIHPLPLTVP